MLRRGGWTRGSLQREHYRECRALAHCAGYVDAALMVFDDTARRDADHNRKEIYISLAPPASFGPLTVKNVLEADGAAEHMAAVQLWANSVWQAWAEHHVAVRGWVRELVGSSPMPRH
ncbi:MAG TPA: DUF5946 family protein [Candidatus Sulfotelmatobacter sp.]|nr:DUF5946 family protein [Candidatus Sulfotelmatobacter sp.]